MKSYASLLNRLYLLNSGRGVRLGLEAMRQLDQILGCPSKAFRSVHIAGTNGKGSVAWKVAAALKAAGYRVGLYTSPHIATFRERIRIDGELVSEEMVRERLEEIFFLVERDALPTTFFEVTTALAWNCFRACGVEIAVVEVGIGGRLDATNILLSEVAAITSVSYDHSDLLGDSLESVAREKAGILKKGVPAVLGPNVPRVVDEMACQLGCSVLRSGDPFADVDLQNASIAKTILQLLQCSASKEALLERPPCRQQVVHVEGTEVILDVAHNEASLHALFCGLAEKMKPIVVLALGRNKDAVRCLSHLRGRVHDLILADSTHPRLRPAEELETVCQELRLVRLESLFIEGSVAQAVRMGLQRAQGRPLVVAGSFFMMAEARSAIGFCDSADAVDLNETAVHRLVKE